MTAIHLGCPLPNTSSGQPEERRRRAASQFPRELLSLFGLAPDGVCLLFTLDSGKPDQVSFLWHCPCITAPGISPASCPVEPGLSSKSNWIPQPSTRPETPSCSKKNCQKSRLHNYRKGDKHKFFRLLSRPLSGEGSLLDTLRRSSA